MMTFGKSVSNLDNNPDNRTWKIQGVSYVCFVSLALCLCVCHIFTPSPVDAFWDNKDVLEIDNKYILFISSAG